MPSYDRTPTPGQVMNSFLGAVDTVTDVTVNAVKAQAQSDLLFMQANFDKDQNDFLLELQNSNDYENYQQKYQDFMQKLTSSTQNKDSPYYCRNSFTAKKASEMFASQQAALENKVNDIVNTKRIQESLVTSDETKRLLMETKNPTEALAAMNAIDNNNYANGHINIEELNNNLRNNQIMVANTASNNYLTDNADSEIAAGLSAESSWEKFMESDDIQGLTSYAIPSSEANPDYIAQGGELTPVALAKDSTLYNNVKKMYIQNYNAKVQEMQDKNSNQLSQDFTNMVKTTDPVQKLALCRQALNTISRDMSGNRLEEQKRVTYTKLFQGEIDDLSKAGSGSGSGSSSSLDRYSDMVKNLPDTFMALVEDGTLNYYDAKEALENTLAEVYYSTDGVWKETEKLKTKEERDAYFLNNYGKAGVDAILNNTVLTKALNDPMYKDLKTKWEKLSKDVSDDMKNPIEKRKYSANALNIAAAFEMDFIAQNGKGILSKEQVEEEEQFLNNICLDQLEKNFKGAGNKNDKQIVNGIDILNKNDAVFTDAKGNVVWASEKYKAKVDEVAQQQQSVMAKALGVSEADLGPYDFLRTKDDIKPIPVWSYNGDRYHLETTSDGKSYEVVDQNGVHYDANSFAEQRAAYKMDKKEQKEKRKEATVEAGKAIQAKDAEYSDAMYSAYTPAQRGRLR